MISQLTIFGEELELTDQPSFPEVSPASPSVWLESKKVKGTTVTCGRKCSGLSENLRRVGLSVRTYLESCELPLTTFARTWSVLATKSGYSILKLRLSEHCTGEKGSRLWLTPRASEAEGRGTYATFDALKSGVLDKGHGLLLTNQVKFPQLWPTLGTNGGPNQRDSSGRPGLQMAAMMWHTPSGQEPGIKPERLVCADGSPPRPGERLYDRLTGRLAQVGLTQQARLWPTPTTRDYKDGSAQSCANVPVNGLLGRAIHVGSESAQENTGQLNPTFVEWLMGFPRDWTEV